MKVVLEVDQDDLELMNLALDELIIAYKGGIEYREQYMLDISEEVEGIKRMEGMMNQLAKYFE